jgi:alpha-beta hydrolase superfamily lysophospholipase
MREQAVLIPRPNGLVGVVSSPSQDAAGRPIIVFLNAGIVHRVGPHRLYVRLARTLTESGFTCLRFDLSGIGDSPPRTDGVPLHAAALRDVQDALSFMGGPDATFVLIGLCSGADAAFRAALGDQRVVGAVLIDGFPYHTFQSRVRKRLRAYRYRVRGLTWQKLVGRNGLAWRLVSRARRVSVQRPPHVVPARKRDMPSRETAEAGLERLLDRGISLLVINTPDRDYGYARHFEDAFPSVRSPRVTRAYFANSDHTFTLRANQDQLIRTVSQWITCFK